MPAGLLLRLWGTEALGGFEGAGKLSPEAS